MANKEFAKYTADQTWETNGGDFENVPDGVYTGKFEFVEVKKSGSAFWMLVMKFLITASEEEGEAFIDKSHFVNLMFEGKNGWNPWKVKAFFKEIGVELPEFKDVEPTLQELIDNNTGFVFEVKTKNDFTNTKIIKVLEDFTVDGDADGSDADESSDMPSEEDINDMSKEELIAFAEEHEIELGSKMLSKMKIAVKAWVEENTSSEDDDSDAEDLPSEEDVDEMDKGDLIAFAEEHEIELNTKILSKMKAAIKTWISENSSDDSDTSADDELKEKLIEFAASHGIDDIDDDTSIDDAKELISEQKFNEDELTDEEKELLTDNELGECIVKRKKTSSKPAAKTGKKK